MAYSAYTHSLTATLCAVLSFSAIANHSQSIEKNFVIVIPSYNNKNWYKHNLQSVLSQNYNHFRVIYTDDCSPDGTGDLVEAYLAENDGDHKTCLVKNKSRRGALHNLYTMIHTTDDNDIIVTLDGDDWFPDNDVLTRLNDVYSSDEVWLTYGQFEMHPSGTKGWACSMPDYIVENNTFRDFQHLPTHLRTFYSWLFKKINLEDLLYKGNFYPMTWDMAMMFPMIEMAGKHHKFIPEIMYTYNDGNSISDHNVSRQLQAHLAQIIKKNIRYKPILENRHMQPTAHSEHADAIIFAHNPLTLGQSLQSFQTYVDGVDHISVMYKPTSDSQADDYNTLQNMYPEVMFHLISDHRANFQSTLFNIYQKSNNDYILFIKDDAQFTKQLSLPTCINALHDIHAYAFYFKLNAQEGMHNYPNMPLVECKNNISAWVFSHARDKWSCANSLNVVLHKKTDLLAQALQSHYDLTPNGLEAVWANEGNLDRLGLCFNESYVK